jgi:uncharacterized LabA/DUF88 family protein
MIDFDNVTMAIRSNLGQELRNFLTSDIVRGKVSVQRAYADWRRYPQYIVPLSEASIDLIFAPAYGSSKKNATDIRLAIDCLELVFTRPEIGTYILLSGDSDFSSLVLKLKEYGKYVIGVGLQESTSDLLVQNCDEYYSYSSLSGLTSAEEMTTQSHDPWQLVGTAVQRMEERDDVMRSDRLKQVMLEIDGGFDEKDHGFSKFNRFLAEASSRGLVRLRKMGDGQYEVAPGAGVEEEADGGAPAQAPPEEEARRTASNGGRGSGGRGSDRGGRSRRRGGEDGGSRSRPSPTGPEAPPKIEAASLREGYELLADVVADLADDGEPVRDSEVKREMLRRNSSFDETSLGFSKFSRFLRQAHDEEVVDVEKDDDGNYHLAPAGRGATPTARPEPEARPEPSEAPDEPRRERGAPADDGRRDRGGRATEQAAAGPAPDADETSDREADEASPAEAPAPEGGGSGDGRETEDRPRARRGMGRFRPGSRAPDAGPSGSSDEDEGVPGPVGPVDAGADGDAAGEEPSTGAGETSPTSERTTGRSRRGRGLGRFRRGQDGASSGEDREEADDSPGTPAMGPVDSGDTGATEETDADAAAPDGGETRPEAREGRRAAGATAEAGGQGDAPDDSGDPASSDAPPVGPSDDPVAHMMGSYPGVGRKTAEKLVEAFGDDVFDVIDREPGRLTKVLPEHRAEAVIEARRAERERVGA